MTPEIVYDTITKNETISSQGAIVLKMICSYFDLCNKGFKCQDMPKSKMLDFDLIEKVWHSFKGEPSTASTDGLAYTSQYLCFIEAKGWKKFLEHQNELKKVSITNQEKERVVKRIEKQAQKYQFQKKLLDSISICEEIVGENSILGQVPILYILVTDACLTSEKNAQQDSITYLFQQLDYLANTSTTDWEIICAENMRERFNKSIKNIGYILPRFIQCKQLDDILL
ncbi:MAG: hypothetical protein IJB61_05205 [Bacteroides sp]|nr:hypothetical protein [Bacteroides sp.]